jgi:phosphatidylglycerol---prolipoprotein diacylglyceryl transferase
VILWGLRRRALPEGRLFTLFLVLYAVVRFLVEFTREPDAQVGFLAFGWLTMGQLLSLCMIVLALCTWPFHRQVVADSGDGGTKEESGRVGEA